MKKLSALLLALCLLIGVFAGCGGTASTPEASAPAAASEQETPDVQEEAPEVEDPEPEDDTAVEEPSAAEEIVEPAVTIEYHGLRQKLCCTTTAVESGTLYYSNFKGQKKSLEFDSIIVSGGVHPRTEEALAYYGSAPEFYIAGDCAGDGEGSLQKALRSAYGIAMQI